jgi:hypothetical protein
MPGTLFLKCAGKRTETRFRLSAKRSSFKSAGASVQSTTSSRGVRISVTNAGCTIFRGSVKGTGYPLHSPFSPSLPLPTSPCAITFERNSTKTVRYARKHNYNYNPGLDHLQAFSLLFIDQLHLMTQNLVLLNAKRVPCFYLYRALC